MHKCMNQTQKKYGAHTIESRLLGQGRTHKRKQAKRVYIPLTVRRDDQYLCGGILE